MSRILRATYFDASSLAKRYLDEPGCKQVLGLLSEGLVATSRFTEVEIASALARRCREGSIELAERDRALDALVADSGSIFLVEITPVVTQRSRSLLERHPLRAADALQLASCLELAAQLPIATRFSAFDRRLLEAAEAEGLELAS